MHMTRTEPGPLGELLHRHRQQRGWSLEEAADELAQSLGTISANALWKWEQGLTRPGVEKWAVIEDTYGMPAGSIERAITGREAVELDHQLPEGQRGSIENLTILPAALHAKLSELDEEGRARALARLEGYIDAELDRA